MQLKTEKSFRDFLKTLPDDAIIRYYLDVEWSPFPILIIKEYQQRFKSKTKDQILNSLRLQANVARKKSKYMKRLVKRKGIDVMAISRIKADEIKKAAKKKGFDIEGISDQSTRKILETKKQIRKTIAKTPQQKKTKLELLEKLDALRKSGIITQKEFQRKKKEILSEI